MKIGHQKHFWISKYQYDDLPYIDYQSLGQIIENYKKIKIANTTAKQLINHFSMFKSEVIMQVYIDDITKAKWLPKEIVDKIESINHDAYSNDLDMNSFLYFNFHKKSISFELALSDILWDTDGSLDLDITEVIVGDEFVLYLTKLFYYEKEIDFSLNVNDEEFYNILEETIQ